MRLRDMDTLHHRICGAKMQHIPDFVAYQVSSGELQNARLRTPHDRLQRAPTAAHSRPLVAVARLEQHVHAQRDADRPQNSTSPDGGLSGTEPSHAGAPSEEEAAAAHELQRDTSQDAAADSVPLDDSSSALEQARHAQVDTNLLIWQQLSSTLVQSLPTSSIGYIEQLSAPFQAWYVALFAALWHGAACIYGEWRRSRAKPKTGVQPHRVHMLLCGKSTSANQAVDIMVIEGQKASKDSAAAGLRAMPDTMLRRRPDSDATQRLYFGLQRRAKWETDRVQSLHSFLQMHQGSWQRPNGLPYSLDVRVMPASVTREKLKGEEWNTQSDLVCSSKLMHVGVQANSRLQR